MSEPLWDEIDPIAHYNTRYADFVRRAIDAPEHTEWVLTEAHRYAAGMDCRPPEGWPQVNATDSVYTCGRCEDTGFTAFYWVDGGRCFACNWDGHITLQSKSCGEITGSEYWPDENQHMPVFCERRVGLNEHGQCKEHAAIALTTGSASAAA